MDQSISREEVLSKKQTNITMGGAAGRRSGAEADAGLPVPCENIYRSNIRKDRWRILADLMFVFPILMPLVLV
jgi:hypothetical protein